MQPALPPLAVPPAGDAPWWRRRASWVYDGILAGRMTDHSGSQVRTYPVAIESIGTIDLPEGRLVACDPYVADGIAGAFEQVVPRGAAEVLAARALVDVDHERVAALLLRWGAGPVVNWRMATVGGEDAGTLPDRHFYGYGVDAGAGAFGSPEAIRVAAKVFEKDEGMLEDPISTAMFADGVGTRSAVVMPPKRRAAAVAVCSAGWGDGEYPTWLGIGAAGDVVLVVTDFLLVDGPDAEPL